MGQLKNQNQVTKVVQDLETPVFVKMNDDKPIYKNKKAQQVLEYIKNSMPLA